MGPERGSDETGGTGGAGEGRGGGTRAAQHGREGGRNGSAGRRLNQKNVPKGRGRGRGGEKEDGQEKRQNRGSGALRRNDCGGDDFGGHAARTIYRARALPVHYFAARRAGCCNVA